jgi:hypothetical protein
VKKLLISLNPIKTKVFEIGLFLRDTTVSQLTSLNSTIKIKNISTILEGGWALEYSGFPQN